MSVVEQNITNIPAYIFGENSSLGSVDLAAVAALSKGSVPYWFVVVVVVVVALYLVWINYWASRSDNHSTVFRFLGYHRGNYSSKLELLSPSFGAYIYSGLLLSFVTVWIAVIISTGIGSSFDFRLIGLVLIGVIGLYLYQVTVINIIGVVVDSRSFAKMALTIKGVLYSILSIALTPMVLCYSLTNGRAQEVFMYIVAAQMITLVLLFIFEIFLLFISKKVSVLHTILYLCTVEIFPLTLIWGLFGR